MLQPTDSLTGYPTGAPALRTYTGWHIDLFVQKRLQTVVVLVFPRIPKSRAGLATDSQLTRTALCTQGASHGGRWPSMSEPAIMRKSRMNSPQIASRRIMCAAFHLRNL